MRTWSVSGRDWNRCLPNRVRNERHAERIDEGGRSVKFWEVETAGIDLKDRVTHGTDTVLQVLVGRRS